MAVRIAMGPAMAVPVAMGMATAMGMGMPVPLPVAVAVATLVIPVACRPSSGHLSDCRRPGRGLDGEGK